MEEVVSFRVSRSRLAEDVALVAVTGELDLYSAPELQAELSALPPGTTWLVLDLLQVTFVDSAGLGVLTAAARRFRYAGGGVVLAAADRNVERVLELTGLGRYFDVCAAADDAVRLALARALETGSAAAE